MEILQEALSWLLSNKENMALALLSLVSLAEIVVRITPTKSDDGAVQRVGALIKKALDLLKLPNVKK
jgi:hypothetical protein